MIRLIDEQGKLTDELKEAITKATKLQEVEDLYRPYKQKRRTKATIAKEKGLEPFAEWLLTFPNESITERAQLFIDEQKEVHTIEEVIQGAKDIIAEKVSDDATLRQWIRQQTWQTGMIVSVGKEVEKTKACI